MLIIIQKYNLHKVHLKMEFMDLMFEKTPYCLLNHTFILSFWNRCCRIVIPRLLFICLQVQTWRSNADPGAVGVIKDLSLEFGYPGGLMPALPSVLRRGCRQVGTNEDLNLKLDPIVVEHLAHVNPDNSHGETQVLSQAGKGGSNKFS